MDFKSDKTFRILRMYDMLLHGKELRKEELTSIFDIAEKTAQRDIKTLRAYLEDKECELSYDRRENCYKLEKNSAVTLNEKDIFAFSKILIESRAFNKEEFNELINKFLALLLPEQRAPVEKRILNEKVYYLPLHHGKPLLDILWSLATVVSEQKLIHIWYIRQDQTPRDHIIKPVGIMFSEFYFYLIALRDEEKSDFYTVYRVDRITDMEIKDETFDLPYADRFSEAEFRKRVQFMYSGPLKRVKFIYRGSNVEAVLDRLPTAVIVDKLEDGGFVITAESYGDGIYMWLDSQRKWVEIIK